MNGYFFERSSYLIRASFLVREILLVFVAEADDVQHPLVKFFGFDEKTYRFVKRLTAAALLKLAAGFVKAHAVTFTLNERQFHRLLQQKLANETPPSHQSEPEQFDSVFGHQTVVRTLLMFMADSLSVGSVDSSSLINFGTETRRLLAQANSQQLEVLAQKMLENHCVQFNFNQHKIKACTYAQMRHERREAIKNFFVIQKATYAMMSFLFSEENEDAVKRRRYRLGVAPLKGRPKTAPNDDYVEYICLWTSNQHLTERDRFLLIHDKLGYTFETLWALYQRANADGDFDERIMKLLNKKAETSPYPIAYKNPPIEDLAFP